MEQSCSSSTSPLPFCGLSFSCSQSRAVLGQGGLFEPFYLPALTFALLLTFAKQWGNQGVDWSVPAFCQPAQVLCVVLSRIPWNHQRSEEDNGVVTCYRALSSASKQPNSGLLLWSSPPFSSLLLQDSGSEEKLQPSPPLLTPITWLGRWLQREEDFPSRKAG